MRLRTKSMLNGVHIYTSTYPKTEVKDNATSLRVMSSPPAVGSFLEQDYRYKSVATKTLHDVGLVPVRIAEDRTRDCFV